MPRWLQLLVGAASLCVVVVTVALVVLLVIILPGSAGRIDSEIDARLDEIMAELEASIASAMEPTEAQIDELDNSLSGELRTIREKIERLEGKLEEVEEILDQINIRDETTFRLSRGER